METLVGGLHIPLDCPRELSSQLAPLTCHLRRRLVSKSKHHRHARESFTRITAASIARKNWAEDKHGVP